MTMHSATYEVDRVYFARYLATINAAMRELRRRPSARAALSELSRRFGQRNIVIVLIGASRDGQSRFGCTLLDLEFRNVDETPRAPDCCWYVRREHVWDVLENPWRYLADASLIELPPFNALEGRTSRPSRLCTPNEAGISPNPQESGRLKPAGSGLH